MFREKINLIDGGHNEAVYFHHKFLFYINHTVRSEFFSYTTLTCHKFQLLKSEGFRDSANVLLIR